ncbi:serine hydrolase domain-containing protein [Pseudoclavibacter terrae]|uniref:Beta-lactamase family protein n=1 Tax=Pseudoclavibacter terrae TaxID=1530195 RepID=A0A7J5AXE0_9MICO|nr:serine hydrolase domain-containing protein [Pseudoclavibacter terrae]KAB1636079.1 beta-lactamase family protein [Pseudoclavibacter terrae]
MNTNMSDPRLDREIERSLELGETGISVTAYQNGRHLVSAWGGATAEGSDRPIHQDDLFGVFSVTKGATATLAAIMADRGWLDTGALVIDYWPEYGANGKESTRVRDLLSHRAGIPQMPEGVTPELLANWDWMVEKIADHSPQFPPGEQNAYHVLVWGWLVGEVIRRADPQGRDFATIMKDELLTPVGATDFYLGVPDSELDRVVPLSGGDAAFAVDEFNVMPEAVFPGSTVHNLRSMQQAVDPGAGARTTADSAARIFAMLANGGEIDGTRVLSRERTAALSAPRDGAHDPEQILPIPVWFGAHGFWLGGEPDISDPIVGEGTNTIYSPGAGGSIAWAELDSGLAVAICHNNMDAASAAAPGPGHPFTAIVDKIRSLATEKEHIND